MVVVSRDPGHIVVRELPSDTSTVEQLITWQIDEYAPSFPSFDHADWTEFYDNWAKRGNDPLPIVLAGYDDGEFFGSVAVVERDDLTGVDHWTPWIAAMIVRPDMRGRGRGLHLLDAALQRCREMGLSKIHLWTENRSAWYLQLGWTVEAEMTFRGVPITVMSHVID